MRAAVFAAAADEVVQLPWGFALRSPATPLPRDLNTIHVERDDELAVPALLATARRTGARQIEIWDLGLAERLLPELEAAGAQVQRFLIMLHESGRPPAPPGVERCAPSELTALREEWLRSIPEIADQPGLVPALLEADRRLVTRTPTDGYCVRDGGRPVAMCLAAVAGAVVAVDDVYTTPTHRGRGLGGTVVTAAVAAAERAEVIWLATDAGGLAQALYRRLGFVDRGVVTRFVVDGPRRRT